MKDIASPSTTQYILDKYHLFPKKKYGQNFLTDKQIIEKIIEQASIDEKCAVIEVGPGIGALTQQISRKAGYVRSYEIDKRFQPVYQEFLNNDNVEIVFEDFLKTDLNHIIKLKENYQRIILVANLPYYITTQIIEKVVTTTNVIDEMFIMVQKEVALKYTSDYKSPLLLCIHDRGNIEYLFTVSKKVFIPAPHVDSAILKITLNNPLDKNLYQVLNLSFKQRRKTLYNNLKEEYPGILKVFNECHISEKMRCEELGLDDYKNITKKLY